VRCQENILVVFLEREKSTFSSEEKNIYKLIKYTPKMGGFPNFQCLPLPFHGGFKNSYVINKIGVCGGF
jgi:hypothetical protein